MASFIKLILFCFSNVGFWEIIRRHSKIHVYFLPSLTIAFQTVLLFFAGLLNFLPEMVLFLYLMGFFGLGCYLYKDRNFSLFKTYMKTGFVFLAIVSGIMLIFLRGKVFASYDNFSHWALVVREMLETNRFPNFTDTIITFTEYPLGSSSYIYYFSKLISPSESIQMMAQVYMMLSCIIPLFVFAKKNVLAATAVILAATNFFFVYNIRTTELLVDTLLPLVGMCGLLFAYFACWKSDEKINYFYAALYVVQLIQIKNSGIFFAVLISILMAASIKKNRESMMALISILLPYVSLLLWQKHCAYVFAESEVSKHAMTTENYSAVFGMKTAEEIRMICAAMLKFTLTWKDVWLTGIFILLTGLLVWCFAPKVRRIFIRLTVLSAIIYIIYQAGMLGMYLFSMPGKEATSLASVERYTKTILIAILYMMLISVIRTISCARLKKVHIPIAAAIFGGFLCFLYFSGGVIHTALDYSDNASERKWIESAKEDYAVPDGKSYCILIPKEDGRYTYYLGKYIFRSGNISTFVADTVEGLEKITEEYIFVYDQENPIVTEWIQNNYPEQYGNQVIVRGENK